ncbi:HI1506-related protein [Idiomarina aminovorans]|uniref:HI1506-related protein n=1 Tax=Idiomarina aminovorans TaxID=2914829 RepID=UPI00200498EA|nr:HI1506-related protein [Idiomarina sp. ATCH4]MCK7458499.1 HI1506-related protein [Idiomarina sp. ATCH4]
MIIVTAEVKCRRAGIDFKKGKNEFKQLSAARLAQIEADERLSVEHIKEEKGGDK